MQELSLNILDIAENSVKAGASLITVAVCYRPAADRLTVTITDDGCGMDAETVRKVTDPFYTTRTTRRVGMGLPLWKMAAEMTGGAMTVESAPGVGTTVTAVFGLSHIDRLPLGDLPQTMATLIGDRNPFSLCRAASVRERQPVLPGVNRDRLRAVDLAGKNPLRKVVDHIALDDPLHGTCAIERIVTRRGDPFARLVAVLQPDAVLRKHPAHDAQLDVDDAFDVLVRQRLKHHDLVDTVQELRFELLFHTFLFYLLSVIHK